LLRINESLELRAVSNVDCNVLTGRWLIVLTSLSRRAAWLMASRYGVFVAYPMWLDRWLTCVVAMASGDWSGSRRINGRICRAYHEVWYRGIGAAVENCCYASTVRDIWSIIEHVCELCAQVFDDRGYYIM
jgi:hypothetical protein